MKPVFSVLQRVKRQYIQAIDHWTSRSVNRIAHNDDMILKYVSNEVRRVKYLVKAHFFNRKCFNSIHEILETFKLGWNTNYSDKKAAICRLTLIVKNFFTTKMNSRMPTATIIDSLIASVSFFELLVLNELLVSIPRFSASISKSLCTTGLFPRLTFSRFCYF